jgi:hypothetical protein
MDDYDRLLALTSAAESCNGAARDFVDTFGRDPQFSRYLSAEGQPYCQPAANSQARQRMERAETELDRLQTYIHRWDEASAVLWYVARAVGINLPVIELNGATYQTAHEAARYFAEFLITTLSDVEGVSDIEQSFDLSRRLSPFKSFLDLYGRLQAEHHAAAEIVPLSDDGGDESVNIACHQ